MTNVLIFNIVTGIWDTDSCNFTKNLELGCSELLNKKACNK